MSSLPSFGWAAIARLGLVQACLGAIVVLTTSTLNRVMVVELALPALLPGALVALHYAVQISRPRMGHGSDVGGRRTPWILGGMLVLALGALGAAAAIVLIPLQAALGIALSVLAFVLIGLGVAACGTSLLVLLAKRVVPERRAASATIVWVMMIMGFAVTAGIAGRLLDPYSPARLVAVTAGVCAVALLLSFIAMAGLEGRVAGAQASKPQVDDTVGFRDALAQVWAEPHARRFTVFVFVSMLAYSAQDLILEPFAGSAFGFTPGESTSLSGVQHGGVLVGMILAASAGRAKLGSLRSWTIGGCIASALALAGLTLSGVVGPAWPFRANVFLLGVANGAFSIAAIGSMMQLAGHGREQREGMRMGLWGASQAISFALGGLVGTAASDVARAFIASPALAYALVFALEALLFVVSAVLAKAIGSHDAGEAAERQPITPRPLPPRVRTAEG